MNYNSYNPRSNPLKNHPAGTALNNRGAVATGSKVPATTHTVMADPYARNNFPSEFFIRLQQWGLINNEVTALDLGTGTGIIARGLAKHGCTTYAIDESQAVLAQAIKMTRKEELDVDYKVGSAEDTGMPNKFFDIIVAGNTWEYFQLEPTLKEAGRLLKATGHLIITHFDWLPLKNFAPSISEKLILKYNNKWKGADRNGFYPEWAMDLNETGIFDIETFSFDQQIIYTHESWRNRIKTSNGITNKLNPEQIHIFDTEHQQILTKHFPDNELIIPHRCFTLIARLNNRR